MSFLQDYASRENFNSLTPGYRNTTLLSFVVHARFFESPHRDEYPEVDN